MVNSTQYAVLQKDDLAANAEQIRRAFRSFSNLTDADAVRLAANAQGILLRHLDVDSARALHRALQTEGVAAALVPENELRLLPESRSLHRLELTPPALVTYDLLGRPKPVAWTELGLIAAGAVRHIEVSRTQSERTVLRFNPVFGVFGVSARKITEEGRKVNTASQLILELVLAGGATRYEINAAQFPFKYTIDRPELSTLENFVWLVKEICQRAPAALLNRGARDLCDGVELVRGYAGRQAFGDEMTWLLWNAAQKHRHGAAKVQ